jgi:hypothetical protein
MQGGRYAQRTAEELREAIVQFERDVAVVDVRWAEHRRYRLITLIQNETDELLDFCNDQVFEENTRTALTALINQRWPGVTVVQLRDIVGKPNNYHRACHYICCNINRVLSHWLHRLTKPQGTVAIDVSVKSDSSLKVKVWSCEPLHDASSHFDQFDGKHKPVIGLCDQRACPRHRVH